MTDITALVQELIDAGCNPAVAGSVVARVLATGASTAPYRVMSGAKRTAKWRANKDVGECDNTKAVTKCDESDENVTNVTSLSPSTSPSLLSPTPPINSPPLTPPIPHIRTIDLVFERFWRADPKRGGPNPKYPARDKFVRLIRDGLDPEVLITGAKAYAAAEAKNVGTTFIAQTIKWLNQRYWEEYPACSGEIVDEAKFAELLAKHQAKKARQE